MDRHGNTSAASIPLAFDVAVKDGRIKPGQKATFTVDAFPGRTFEGQVRQVRKAATNVSNVITYVAVVSFANRDNRLLPGLALNTELRGPLSRLQAGEAERPVRVGGRPGGGGQAQEYKRDRTAPYTPDWREEIPAGSFYLSRAPGSFRVFRADGHPLIVSHGRCVEGAI